MSDKGESPTVEPQAPGQTVNKNETGSTTRPVMFPYETGILRQAIEDNRRAVEKARKELLAEGKSDAEVEEYLRPATNEELKQSIQEIDKEKNSWINRVYDRFVRWLGLD